MSEREDSDEDRLGSEEVGRLGLLCYLEAHLYFDSIPFGLSIFQLGKVDREIIHVGVRFRSLPDPMRVVGRLEALAVGCGPWAGEGGGQRGRSFGADKSRALGIGTAHTWFSSE